MTREKTVLISGASGFLGKEVVSQLLRDTEYHVIAITSQPEKLIQTFSNVDGAERLRVLPTDSWANAIDKGTIDICLNCAFPRSSDPASLAAGLDFTEKFIKEIIALGMKQIINISSQSVYSQQAKEQTDETATVAPESLYGMAKYASEKIVNTLAESATSPVYATNIRLASLTGRTFEVRMTNRFVKKALLGETITIQGGTQKIAYLEVRDAATALIKMLATDGATWHNVYNLGTMYEASVLEIAETVKETARAYGVERVNIEVTSSDANFNNIIDSSRFYTTFNWEPHYTIPQMITDLFAYYTEKA